MTTVVIGGLIAKGNNISSTDTTLQIWGLYHLVGITVSVLLGGLDLGDFTVAADGSVTVSLVVTANQTAAWSAAQLVAMTGDYGECTMRAYLNPGTGAVFVDIPCVIGQAYVSQAQRLRLATNQDAKTMTGPTLGMTRRTHLYSALVQDVVQITFGTLLAPSPLGNMDAWDTVDPVTGTAIAGGVAYSGVIIGTLEDGYSFDSMLCWQVNRPYPATVSAVSSFVQTQERNHK